MTVAVFAFTFTWIRLPETKGRTFDDIAEEFRGAEEIPLHNKTGFSTFTWPPWATGTLSNHNHALKGSVKQVYRILVVVGNWIVLEFWDF